MVTVTEAGGTAVAVIGAKTGNIVTEQRTAGDSWKSLKTFKGLVLFRAMQDVWMPTRCLSGSQLSVKCGFPHGPKLPQCLRTAGQPLADSTRMVAAGSRYQVSTGGVGCFTRHHRSNRGKETVGRRCRVGGAGEGVRGCFGRSVSSRHAASAFGEQSARYRNGTRALIAIRARGDGRRWQGQTCTWYYAASIGGLRCSVFRRNKSTF